MDDQTLIRFLYRTGHFWNPEYPEVLGIKESDLPFLSLIDRAVQYAVASFQMSDENFRPLVYTYHKRSPLFDGLVGPATRELATWNRCPLPDFAPPKNTIFDYQDDDLNKAVTSMQATGNGSWPAGCYGTQGVHEVKISYDLSNLTAKHKEWWPEIKTRSHQAVADVGLKLIEVPVGEDANVTVYGRVLGGSVIGMSEFNNESCDDSAFCQLNPNYAPDIDMVLNLLLHENGHNWNLNHRAGNIMNPSILRTPTYWVKREGGQIVYQDNSYPTLKEYFGGEPLTPPAPPTPTPAPYQITFESNLPAGPCSITAKNSVILAVVSSDRPAGTYWLTHVDPLPPS